MFHCWSIRPGCVQGRSRTRQPKSKQEGERHDAKKGRRQRIPRKRHKRRGYGAEFEGPKAVPRALLFVVVGYDQRTRVLKVDRSWAPKGVDRFYPGQSCYYTDVAFFRVILIHGSSGASWKARNQQHLAGCSYR